MRSRKLPILGDNKLKEIQIWAERGATRLEKRELLSIVSELQLLRQAKREFLGHTIFFMEEQSGQNPDSGILEFIGNPVDTPVLMEIYRKHQNG